MSCRHSLALGTCKECYPSTGTVVPTGPGDSMDGPGACIPPSSEAVRLHCHWYGKCRTCRHWDGKDRYAILTLPEEERGTCRNEKSTAFGKALFWDGGCKQWATFDPEAEEFFLRCYESGKDAMKELEQAGETR